MLTVSLLMVVLTVGAMRTAPATTYVLYIPSVNAPTQPVSDVTRGLAGFRFSPNGAAAMSYKQMRVGALIHWQTMVTPTWQNNTGAYPLPVQPLNFFRSLPGQTWFNLNLLGVSCGTRTQAELAICAGNVVRGQGAIYTIVFNEPDNTDITAGDDLSPAEMAADWYIVRTTLLAANPSVRFVVGNFLWPNTIYVSQFISYYQTSYSAYPLGPNDRWGWHSYANVNNTICKNPYTVYSSTCVATTFGSEINNITRTVAALSPVRNWWLTEWGVDSQSLTDVTTTGFLLPYICHQAANAGAEKTFLYIGEWVAGSIVTNSALIDVDGSLTPYGEAYTAC